MNHLKIGFILGPRRRPKATRARTARTTRESTARTAIIFVKEMLYIILKEKM